MADETPAASAETPAKKKNWFARHKVWTVILAIIAIAVIANAGGKTSKTQNQSSQQSASTTAAKSEYAVGEPASIGDQTLTVTKVTRNFNTGNEFSAPETGKEFVVVEAKIENNGKNQVDFNTFDFQIQDSNGVQKNEDVVVGVENKLNSGSLAGGGKVTGNLSFQVPKGDTGLKLIFKPSFWSNKSVTIKL